VVIGPPHEIRNDAHRGIEGVVQIDRDRRSVRVERRDPNAWVVSREG
jgi:hypothetical protein